LVGHVNVELKPEKTCRPILGRQKESKKKVERNLFRHCGNI